MTGAKQSPAVVIATRRRLVDDLSEFGGRPIAESTREQIADWLIGNDHLAESYFTQAAETAGLTEGEPE